MFRFTKHAIVLSLLAGAIAAGGGSALASGADTPGKVFINGWSQDNTISVGGRTLVALRSLNDPEKSTYDREWLTYSYDAKTHTVKATSKDKSKTIELKQGQKTATLNGKTVKLDTSVIIREGKTYVPIRFVGESMGAYVSYDAAKKRTIVRTPKGQAEYETLMSGTVGDARKIAVDLGLYYPQGELAPNGEGFRTDFRFPVGEALRFEKEYKQVTQYVEIDSDGIAVVTYQYRKAIDSIKAAEKGVKPKALGEGYYFSNDLLGDRSYYGSIDAQGKQSALGTTGTGGPMAYSAYIVPIEGESRTDGKA